MIQKNNTNEAFIMDGKVVSLEGSRLGWIFIPNQTVTDKKMGVSYMVAAIPLRKTFAFLRDREDALKMAKELLDFFPEMNKTSSQDFVNLLGYSVAEWIKHCNVIRGYVPFKKWAYENLN